MIKYSKVIINTRLSSKIVTCELNTERSNLDLYKYSYIITDVILILKLTVHKIMQE
jgi:hypothetical protein